MPHAPSTNAAIFFHPDGYLTARQDLKGRHVAGESFLTGLFRHADVSEFVCTAGTSEMAATFAELAGRAAPGRPVRWVPLIQPEGLAATGCLFVPGPGIDQFAWQRRRVGQRAYSLCGITHTTSETPDMFGGLLTGPIQPWDAVICTSRAARSSVEAILRPYADYIRDRFGADHCPLPNLPVIPLGIDTTAFQASDEDRSGQRTRLGIDGDDVVVLFLGRLSFHAKAHPIPMYMALERVARQTGRRIHLIQAGWFGNDAIGKSFADGARRYAPSINAIFLDGRHPDVRNRIWAAADIFVSLVDNIQETFGITPVEAMAAGLPGVVTDWNGYRETVRDGIDGFRIPTMLPPPGIGLDIAERYATTLDTYDYYIGRTSQITAVDIDATVQAFERLVTDPALRRQMGDAARERAAAVFDWKVIIPQYQALWAELAVVRANAGETAPWIRDGRAPADPAIGPNPLRPDPLAMFASYPTRTLTGDTWLVRTEDASPELLSLLASDPMNSPAGAVVSPMADLLLVIEACAPPFGRTAAAIIEIVPPERRGMLARSLVHLLKFGLLRRIDAPTDR